MNHKIDRDTYIIPPNFIESGTFFGGMFKARNVIEAGILAFAIALLCAPVKTAELDRILLQGLTARQPGLAIEHDGVSPDGSPVLFGYFCDLPRIARFNTSLELSERPGTLICFDFQAEVLRSYCGSRVRFQTIDFTKFEGRLFP